MRERINTYFGTLFITIIGAGAALLIVHVATDTSTAFDRSAAIQESVSTR